MPVIKAVHPQTDYPGGMPVGPDLRDAQSEGDATRDLTGPAGIDMTDGELSTTVVALIEEAVTYVDGELSPERAKLADYFYGLLPKPDAEPGRSEVVIRPFADAVNRMMPSLLKVFFGGERYVEFRPRKAAAVKVAQQQTAYIDEIVIQEDNNGLITFHAWFWDGLVKRMGVVKWWPQEKVSTDVLVGTSYTKDALNALTAEDGVEIMKVRPAELSTPGSAMYDVTYRRTRREWLAKFATLPPEEFLTTRKPRDIDESPLVGHRTEKTTAQLLAMGVEMDTIKNFGGVDAALRHNQEEVGRTKGGFKSEIEDTLPTPALHDMHLWIESWVELPYKKESEYDGAISGLYKITTIGPSYHIVEVVPASTKPFAVLTPDPVPHQLEGRGVGDRTIDLQEVMSFIARSMNNSLALALQNRLAYVEGEVDADDLESHIIGRPIRTQKVGVIQEIKHDFVGREALGVLDFYKSIVEDRVGVANPALDPSSLQSSNAIAVGAVVSQAQLQTEFIARVFADTGIKRLMKGLLELTIEHPNPDRVLKQQGEWVQPDFEAWDPALTVSVNVGLGGGLVEQRYAALAEAGAVQQAVLTTVGLDNPLVTPGTFAEIQRRKLQLRGFKDAELIWPVPNPQWQPQAPPADPNMELVKVEAGRAQAEAEIARQKTELAAEKAKVEEMRKALDLELKREEIHMQDERERDKLEADIAIRVALARAQFGADLDENAVYADIERNRLASEHARGMHKINTDAAAQVAVGTQPQPADEQGD